MADLTVKCACCGTANTLVVAGMLSNGETVCCSRCRQPLGTLGELHAPDRSLPVAPAMCTADAQEGARQSEPTGEGR